MESILYAGLDVHKNSIEVALAEGGRAGEVRRYGRIGGDLDSLDKVVRKLVSTGKEMRFVYEAGPCGYEIYRHLIGRGYECVVVAPSQVPRRSGDRIKNDRRDAMALARLYRAGELTAVYIPTVEDEAMRDLVRGREDAKRDERKAKQRLGAFLLRHGHRYPGRKTWSQAHMRWISDIRMPHPAQQITMHEYITAIHERSDRVDRLTDQIRKLLTTWRMAPVVMALQSLRGVALIVAVTTGNNHVRRALVEAAWAYRLPPRVSRVLLKRQEGLPQQICDISWKAQLRLCGRYKSMMARGKTKQVVITAIARELAGYMWAIAREVTVPT